MKRIQLIIRIGYLALYVCLLRIRRDALVRRNTSLRKRKLQLMAQIQDLEKMGHFDRWA